MSNEYSKKPSGIDPRHHAGTEHSTLVHKGIPHNGDKRIAMHAPQGKEHTHIESIGERHDNDGSKASAKDMRDKMQAEWHPDDLAREAAQQGVPDDNE